MATEREKIERLKQRKVRPATPGDLLADLIECNNLSQGEVAERIGVSRITINRVIQGHRSLTPAMAHRVGRYFGNGPEIWLNLQNKVDLWDALHMDSKDYRHIQPLASVVNRSATNRANGAKGIAKAKEA